MYAFGGYPLQSNSIEMFIDHYTNTFWPGYHISENYDGKIFFFGGGQKYNDTADFYELNAAEQKMEKMKLALPKEDRFFYNSQSIKLGGNRIITMARHGVYKIDFEKKNCFKIGEGYRDLDAIAAAVVKKD